MPFGAVDDCSDDFGIESSVKWDADIGVFDLAVDVYGEGHNDRGLVAFGDPKVRGEGGVVVEIDMPGSPIIGAPAEVAFAVSGCGIGLLVAVLVEILFLEELA